MSTVIIIPARLASTRLESKLLLDLDGKSVLQRTYEQAQQSKLAQEVVIATDHETILEHAQSFGAQVFMTSTEHKSGTDRIAELTLKNPSWQIIVNVQGDEPFINPADIDLAIEPFVHDPLLEMSSLYHQFSEEAEIDNPNNVKVVTDANGMAMYFSRSKIPFVRHCEEQRDEAIQFKKHIGLYAYRRDTLLALAELPQSQLEKQEKLEQLRALENGIKIKMLEVDNPSIGIDTQEDYQEALKAVKSAK